MIPTPGYLAAINAGIGPSQTPGAPEPVTFAPDTISRNGPAAPPVPYGTERMSPQELFGGAAPPPKTPDMFGTQADQVKTAFDAAAKGAAPPPPPAAPSPPPAPSPAGPEAPRFVQRGGSGGVIPAHEVEMRGPSLKRAQDARNAAFAGAADAVAERSQQTAAVEFAHALEQERKAGIREDAANYSAAERNEELAQRQAEFDQSVKALSQASVDPDRFWANKGALARIGAIISVTLGGYVQGMRGGPNAAYDMINNAVDRDIKAQEFSYNALRDSAHAKQTAFSMAMQKYNNVDAARAAARAASMDAVQAQLAQSAAMWKGSDAANRATALGAQLQEDKQNQIQNGIRFLPPSAAPRQFVDRATGLIYSEQEMKGLVKEREERAFKTEEQERGIGGKILEEREKAGLKKDESADKGAQHISQQLQTAGVPQARVAAERALAALNKSPGGVADAGTRWALGQKGGNMVLSEDANAREQAYQEFANQAMKATMGNVTASEEVRANLALGSGMNPESRRRAIASVMQTLEGIEKNAKAGAPVEGQREFDKRRQAAEGGPPTAPKGSKQGW